MRRLAQSWFLPVLVLGVAAALLFPSFVLGFTLWLRPRVVIALALFLMAWTMPTSSLWEEVRRPRAVLSAVMMSYGLAPLLAWLVQPWLPEELGIGLLISTSAPCSLASAVLWTRLAGGNDATALLVTLFTTFTSWLVTPAWLQLTTGTLVELPVLEMMLDLFVTVVVPVSLGQLIRAVPVMEQIARHHKMTLGTFSQLFILAIILQASAKVGERAWTEDMSLRADELAWTILLILGLHLTILSSGLMLGWFVGLDRPRRLAIAFAGSQKTLPVGLVIYESYFQSSHPLAIVPVLTYHVGQLLLDTPIAYWLQGNPEEDGTGESVPGSHRNP